MDTRTNDVKNCMPCKEISDCGLKSEVVYLLVRKIPMRWLITFGKLKGILDSLFK